MELLIYRQVKKKFISKNKVQTPSIYPLAVSYSSSLATDNIPWTCEKRKKSKSKTQNPKKYADERAQHEWTSTIKMNQEHPSI